MIRLYPQVATGRILRFSAPGIDTSCLFFTRTASQSNIENPPWRPSKRGHCVYQSIAKEVKWIDTRSSPGNKIKWAVDSEKPIDLRENSHIVLKMRRAPHMVMQFCVLTRNHRQTKFISTSERTKSPTLPRTYCPGVVERDTSQEQLNLCQVELEKGQSELQKKSDLCNTLSIRLASLTVKPL